MPSSSSPLMFPAPTLIPYLPTGSSWSSPTNFARPPPPHPMMYNTGGPQNYYGSGGGTIISIPYYAPDTTINTSNNSNSSTPRRRKISVIQRPHALQLQLAVDNRKNDESNITGGNDDNNDSTKPTPDQQAPPDMSSTTTSAPPTSQITDDDGFPSAKRSGSFSSLLLEQSKRRNAASSDLPSKLCEIFASGAYRRPQNLTAMKSLTKSCADLRRTDSSSSPSLPTSPLSKAPPASQFISVPTSSSSSPSKGEPSIVSTSAPDRYPKLYPLSPDYLEEDDILLEKQHYQTIHCCATMSSSPNRSSLMSPPPRRRHNVFQPSNRPSPLLSRKSNETQYVAKNDQSSMSDSDDEYFQHQLKVSPIKTSPTKPPVLPSSALRDDPTLLLKTKLKQTHSLVNLPANVQKEAASVNKLLSPPQQPSTPSTANFGLGSGPWIDPVYHTVHGLASPSRSGGGSAGNFGPFGKQYSSHNNSNSSRMMTMMPMMNSEWEYDFDGTGGIDEGCYDGDYNADPGFRGFPGYGTYYNNNNNSRRAGSPSGSSSGYKTMYPSTAYNDPGLMKFLKERDRERVSYSTMDYQNMVRR